MGRRGRNPRGASGVVSAEFEAEGNQIEPCKRARHLQKAEFGAGKCDMQARAVGKGRFVNQDKRPIWQGSLHAMESRPFGGAPLVSIGGEQVERFAHVCEHAR